MSKADTNLYSPGLFAVPGNSPKTKLEEKSPPVSALWPNHQLRRLIGPGRYTSEEEMRLERERLWPKIWLWAGLTSDLTEEGSWLRFDFCGESFIVTRAGEGEYCAFHNICQHRGSWLVSDDFGRQTSFICPRHSWAYDLHGTIKNVENRELFDSAALCGNLDIPQVRCEVWAGMVFICMDDNAVPLKEFLSDLAPMLDIYRLDTMRVVADIVVDMDCNWKTVMHAFMENYHVHATHPNVLPAFEDIRTQFDFYEGGHGRQISMRGIMTSRWPPRKELNSAQEAMLENVGIDPKTFRGEPDDVRQAVQLAKRRPDNVYGLDYSRFGDSQLSDAWAPTVFPNSWWNLNPEGCLGLSVYPDPEDPAKCRLHVLGLAPRIVKGNTLFVIPVRPDFDLAGDERAPRQHISAQAPDLKEVIGLTLWQDVRNLHGSQLGMSSRGLKSIRLSELEQLIQHHLTAIDQYIRPEEI